MGERFLVESLEVEKDLWFYLHDRAGMMIAGLYDGVLIDKITCRPLGTSSWLTDERLRFGVSELMEEYEVVITNLTKDSDKSRRGAHTLLRQNCEKNRNE